MTPSARDPSAQRAEAQELGLVGVCQGWLWCAEGLRDGGYGELLGHRLLEAVDFGDEGRRGVGFVCSDHVGGKVEGFRRSDEV